MEFYKIHILIILVQVDHNSMIYSTLVFDFIH